MINIVAMLTRLLNVLHHLRQYIESLLFMNNLVYDNHFQVEWGGDRRDFTEVIGLSAIREVVETKSGDQKAPFVQKTPGDEQYPNIILRRYLNRGDNQMFEWWMRQSAVEDLRTVIIKLLNKQHEPVFIWELTNAFPARISYSPFSAKKAQPVIEEIELSFDSMRVSIP